MASGSLAGLPLAQISGGLHRDGCRTHDQKKTRQEGEPDQYEQEQAGRGENTEKCYQAYQQREDDVADTEQDVWLFMPDGLLSKCFSVRQNLNTFSDMVSSEADERQHNNDDQKSPDEL